MRRKGRILLLALMPFLVWTAFAAPFDCGSTGADGPMNITSNTTLNLPPNGIFNCTTITVAPGTTLTFSRNALDTPVYLLALGDVVINGAIDVSAPITDCSPTSGQGGPGGFDGGSGGSVMAGQSTGGDGMGPGGGKNRTGWSAGAFGGVAQANTNTYGNLLLVPMIGGSGGAGADGSPGAGGGGGGGAILVASNTRIVVMGTIKAAGAYGFTGNCAGLGSGGAVRLVAPIVSGAGSINTIGGLSYSGSGGLGRIRVDCTDNRAYLPLSLTGVASRGNRMFVFPAVVPRLDIIGVAGQVIPEGTNNAVQFELPADASTNQTVTVQARNFTNDIPIRVVVTPRNSPRGEFDATILQSSGNPPFANIPVIIPAGSICQIHTWTR